MNALDPATPTPALGPTPARAIAPGGAGSDRLRQVAQDFESIFIFQMLDIMNTGLATDGPFGGGPGEKMFRSLMNEEIAKSISTSSGFGIGDAVYRQLLQLQEMRNDNGPG